LASNKFSLITFALNIFEASRNVGLSFPILKTVNKKLDLCDLANSSSDFWPTHHTTFANF